MPLSIPFLLFLSLLSLLTPPSVSVISPSPSPPVSPSIACKSTLYPKLCRSILSAIRSPPSDPYTYGRFSVKQSLKQARKSTSLLEHFLAHGPTRHMEAGALSDCRQLSDLNLDFLATISAELSSTGPLTDEVVDRVRTLLSAIVTNQQTCFDGLEASRSSLLKGVLQAPFSNATELYSVSLGLVNHELGSRKRKGRSLEENRSGGFSPFADSGRERRNLIEGVGNKILVRDSVMVAKDGSGNFTSIGDAVAFAPNNTIAEQGYFVIFVGEGVYEEYVLVAKNKKNLMLIGDGINKTVITGNRSVNDNWTTYNSATFAVVGERFVAINITFKNTAGPEKHQAVAVRNNADLSTFYHCSFEGYQDTLYVHSLRQFYRECDIYGTVDFIFGNAASIFQNCNLFARKPMPGQKIAITAQGRTDPNQNTGISIHNCTVRATPDLAEDLSFSRSYLGRPWKEYSRTVYMQSFIDNLIDPVGWLEWNGTVGLSTLYYGEFENYGPGANTSGRVQWPGYSLMNSSQAMNFTVYNFTMGDTWLPSTIIPFSSGLL
ncbi:probable pectinesterase/pectinesterase inhibitor 47 [Magnolia sinica]|uniref:probable pectinesterase/pectinesterase inhibitor 47 n=1 Tax=Magnolia sinica TaxID=86752 RepID=UPI00265959F9|nr:probable pectinesterase/pectinesterase inhibitor 47 [Magnolia sinica]